jgi:uncharacterized protein (TIGR02271 family)
MARRTLTALFQQRAEAERAEDQLKAAGLSGGDIEIHDQSSSSGSGASSDGGDWMSRVKDFFGGHEDSDTYAEGVRRGNVLLTLKADEDQIEDAYRVLENSSALDVEAVQEEWRGEGWTGGASATGREGYTAAIDVAPGGQVRSASSDATQDNEQAIPLAEEHLRVGKREVERGGVRVRSYVVETPVQEQVSLREEHVSIERRPVNQPASAADNLFQDRQIEVTETAEEAVVAKDAVVREELVVRKDTDQRTETISDTVRRTEVDVEDTLRGRDLQQPKP